MPDDSRLSGGDINDTISIRRILESLSKYPRVFDQDSAICLAENALRLSEKINWNPGISLACFFQGMNYYWLGNKEAAIYFLQRCRLIAEADENISLYKNANKMLGTYYLFWNDQDSATYYLTQSIPDAFKLKDTISVISSYLYLGNSVGNSDHVNAMGYYYKALKYSELIKNKKFIFSSYRNIGSILVHEKLYPEASKYFYKYLTYSLAEKDKTEESFAYSHLVVLHNAQDHFDSMYYYANKLIEIYSETHNEFDYALAYYYLARYYNDKLMPDTALHLLEVGLKVSLPNRSYDVYFWSEMGVSYQLKGDYNKAIQLFERVVNSPGSNDDMEELAKNYKYLAVVYEKMGNYTKAYQAGMKHISIVDSLRNTNTQFVIGKGELDIELNKQKNRIDSLQNEKQVQSIITNETTQKRNLAYAFSICLLAGGWYGFLNYRKRKRKDQELALNNERLRISRDLHDEVGATLSGISMYSHVAKEQMKHENRDAVENSLTIMQESSGEMVAKLNDIVWLLNPDQSHLRQLIEKLEDYANQMAVPKGIRITTNVDESISNLELALEVRRNIYLTCKEALNNAVKYSMGSMIQLRVAQTDHYLEFIIQDNGIGFDPEKIKRGNGLNNMQQRAEEIGGELKFSTGIKTGTHIILKYKIT